MVAQHEKAPLVLDVSVHWRGDLLTLRRFEGSGEARIGDLPDAVAPIPCGALGISGFTIARLDGGEIVAHVPQGVVASLSRREGGFALVAGPAEAALRAGESIELPVGEFFVRASASPRGRLRIGGKRAAGAWIHVGLAAAAHLCILGAASHAARASMLEDDDGRAETMRGLLISAEQRTELRAAVVEGLGSAGGGKEANGRNGDGRDGGGALAARDAGKMGDPTARARREHRYAIPKRTREPATTLPRASALADATDLGLIGLLSDGARPTPWLQANDASGSDPVAARGGLYGPSYGADYAPEGLALSGIGQGGGGKAEGTIGLGAIGTLGHTDGRPGAGTGGEGSLASGRSGHWGGGWRDSWGVGVPGLRRGRLTKRLSPHWRSGSWGEGDGVSGRLPPEAIQRIVRQNFGRIRLCYEAGLVRNPALAGTVTTRFLIAASGGVASAENGDSSLPDPAVVACVTRAFYGLSFPEPPDARSITVTYPITFSPS